LVEHVSANPPLNVLTTVTTAFWADQVLIFVTGMIYMGGDLGKRFARGASEAGLNKSPSVIILCCFEALLKPF
jgi:hypothetical protein